MLPCFGWVYRQQLVYVLCEVLIAILQQAKWQPTSRGPQP